MEQPNQENIHRSVKKKTYKYFRILEADTNKVEMKEKIKKDYLWRTRKLLETKLCDRNLIKRINTWAVLLVRYSVHSWRGRDKNFKKWPREQEN